MPGCARAGGLRNQGTRVPSSQDPRSWRPHCADLTRLLFFPNSSCAVPGWLLPSCCPVAPGAPSLWAPHSALLFSTPSTSQLPVLKTSYLFAVLCVFSSPLECDVSPPTPLLSPHTASGMWLAPRKIHLSSGKERLAPSCRATRGRAIAGYPERPRGPHCSEVNSCSLGRWAPPGVPQAGQGPCGLPPGQGVSLSKLAFPWDMGE